jgi:hypothetical protein
VMSGNQVNGSVQSPLAVCQRPCALDFKRMKKGMHSCGVIPADHQTSPLLLCLLQHQ